jgi:hypothetical protein
MQIRHDTFITEARETALMHARRKAFAKGRGFVLRKSDAEDASLQCAAAAFARRPTLANGASIRTQAIDAIPQDDAERWFPSRLADVAPRTDALDHFESAQAVAEMFEQHMLESNDDAGNFNSENLPAHPCATPVS